MNWHAAPLLCVYVAQFDWAIDELFTEKNAIFANHARQKLKAN